jgi:hypothetical protein
MTYHHDHLRGTRREDGLELPVVPTFDTEPVELRGIDLLYATFESSHAGSLDLLPSSLHPSIPPHLTFIVQTCTDSEFGPFQFAQVRVGCRAGVSHRAFGLTTVVDSVPAATALRERWGFRCRPGMIELHAHYDRHRAMVVVAGEVVLDVEAYRAAAPMDPSIIIVAPVLHWADTPLGERLVQASPKYALTEANRGRAVLRVFRSEFWDARPVTPLHPVSAVTASGAVLMRPIQYVVDTMELSEDSTEMLSA